MKKLIAILLIIGSGYFILKPVNEGKTIIPNTSIRVRIIPNSNSIYDQSMKLLVKDYIEKNLATTLGKASNIKEAQNVINSNINSLNKAVNELFKNNDYDKNFQIKYGNYFFPKKTYHNIIYNEGYYESLVITIGEGHGDNWWCVLFPPICLLENDNNNNVEYSFLISDIIKNFF